MAISVPAMKARMGDTDYFIVSMKAEELANKVKIPREMDDWGTKTLEERYQRTLDYNRVRSQIAPYLASNQSRFFGSVIVALENFDAKKAFSTLRETVTKRLPVNYQADAEAFGFLTFSGAEVWVPLDGQHRLKAIQFAVSGRDERGREIEAIPVACRDLADDDITVLLIDFELAKARDIFTHVNLYAKKTPTGQNIVTNDDDAFAILSREVANELLSERMVKFTSNTLNKRDPQFTTLAIVYNCIEEIVTTNFPNGAVKKDVRPPAQRLALFSRKVKDVWKDLIENVDVFSAALSDPEQTGDDRRCELRAANLLGKPVAQECLVGSYLRLVNPPNRLAGKEACRRLNLLPWAQTPDNLEVWDRVLWTGGTDGKIVTKNRRLIKRIITHMAGGNLTGEEQADLLHDYRQLFPDSEREQQRLPAVVAK